MYGLRPDNVAQPETHGEKLPQWLADGGATTTAVAAASTPRAKSRKMAKSSSSLPTTSQTLQRLVTTSPDECAECDSRAPGDACSLPEVISNLAEMIRAVPVRRDVEKQETRGRESAESSSSSPVILPTAKTKAAGIVRKAAKLLGCTSESCVVTHPRFRQHAGEPLVQRNLESRFKEFGPRDTLALTSNYNLDGTLQKWARVFPEFYPYPFCMMNFEATGEALARISPVLWLEGNAPVDLGLPGQRTVYRACTHGGCIVNTDLAPGKGKHWVAVFIDCRPIDGPWTIEYFNSSGNPPPRRMVRWMEQRSGELATYRAQSRGAAGGVRTVPVTSARHQESDTECGLYALFYIRSRCEGHPYTEFAGSRIADETMVEFRKHVFRRHR